MQLPDAFFERMKQDLGTEFPDFLAALGQPPPVSIRLHPARNASNFGYAGIVPWHSHGRYLPERPVFTLDPAFHAGAYYVQEASSMFVREALVQGADLLSKKLRVLDLCAAPGGKSTLLASALNPQSLLVANEAIQSRVAPLRTNLEKWGSANAIVSNHDPADFKPLAGFFDVVLVDTPCSGEGLFRKNLAATGEWSEQNLALCAGRQRRILTEAMELVSPGGLLIYSTCTFNPAENEQNVAWMLESGEFSHFTLKLEENWGIVPKETGYQFYPHRLQGEGFFLACLKKKDGPDRKMNLKPDGFRGWQRLPAKQTERFAEWLADPGGNVYFEKPGGELVAVPGPLEEDFAAVGLVLKKRSLGTVIGQLKNKDFVPSHAFALSELIASGLPAVELRMEDALAFLKKESQWMDGLPKGWALARFNGLNLGWMKVLDNRINNYLPNDWRIRMEVR